MSSLVGQEFGGNTDIFMVRRGMYLEYDRVEWWSIHGTRVSVSSLEESNGNEWTSALSPFPFI